MGNVGFAWSAWSAIEKVLSGDAWISRSRANFALVVLSKAQKQFMLADELLCLRADQFFLI